MYVVEFQKRGFPHFYMLIRVDGESKRNLAANVDKFVSAEIPDPLTDHVGYEVVKYLMIYGPCGLENTKSPCIKDMKCFAIYLRRNTGIAIAKGKCNLDNWWVVPYNRHLLVKYQCHMNVKIFCQACSLKYLFKYCLKGHDRTTVEITTHNKNNACLEESVVDEIYAYFDGRYICASETAYRIFGFNIHYRSIYILRLSFHLPGERSCTFSENDSLEKVVCREQQTHSFFLLNRNDPHARKYMYDEIPQYYVWNETDRVWTVRTKGRQIGRLLYTHHSAWELWYLRLLLSNICGSISLESLQSVKGIQHSTFKEACKSLGLLDNDKEWHSVIKECSVSSFPEQIRKLFVHIIVNYEVSDLRNSWDQHWNHMVDNILMKRQTDKLLKSIGTSLKHFKQLPQPPASYLQTGLNNLVVEETSYNLTEMEAYFNSLFSNCNPEQLEIVNEVIKSVESKSSGVYFIYGSGGCGKMFVWKTIIYKLRSLGFIFLPVALSGIAATLMPSGSTAHSRFMIPIVLDDCSSCAISHDSDIGELIKHISLIIWDESPMQHIIGNGVIEAPKGSSLDCGEDEIVILPYFCDPEIKNSIKNMIEWTYPNLLSHYKTPKYLSERDILTLTNLVVGHLKSFIVQSIPGDDFTYNSVDRAENFGGTLLELSFAFPPEYLNSVNLPGLPPHELKLKSLSRNSDDDIMQQIYDYKYDARENLEKSVKKFNLNIALMMEQNIELSRDHKESSTNFTKKVELLLEEVGKLGIEGIMIREEMNKIM
ncbi:uncharacterized protein LOC141690418 [Apium graveolens]|uniref:uncharacterized protein LOC141690418 n=1 Tax=Apium graveolens TaxID=4045 RepID=UPI003D78CD45